MCYPSKKNAGRMQTRSFSIFDVNTGNFESGWELVIPVGLSHPLFDLIDSPLNNDFFFVDPEEAALDAAQSIADSLGNVLTGTNVTATVNVVSTDTDLSAQSVSDIITQQLPPELGLASQVISQNDEDGYPIITAVFNVGGITPPNELALQAAILHPIAGSGTQLDHLAPVDQVPPLLPVTPVPDIPEAPVLTAPHSPTQMPNEFELVGANLSVTIEMSDSNLSSATDTEASGSIPPLVQSDHAPASTTASSSYHPSSSSAPNYSSENNAATSDNDSDAEATAQLYANNVALLPSYQPVHNEPTAASTTASLLQPLDPSAASSSDMALDPVNGPSITDPMQPLTQQPQIQPLQIPQHLQNVLANHFTHFMQQFGLSAAAGGGLSIGNGVNLNGGISTEGMTVFSGTYDPTMLKPRTSKKTNKLPFTHFPPSKDKPPIFPPIEQFLPERQKEQVGDGRLHLDLGVTLPPAKPMEEYLADQRALKEEEERMLKEQEEKMEEERLEEVEKMDLDDFDFIINRHDLEFKEL